MPLPHETSGASILGLMLLLAGCGGLAGEGERCERELDCEETLSCVGAVDSHTCEAVPVRPVDHCDAIEHFACVRREARGDITLDEARECALSVNATCIDALWVPDCVVTVRQLEQCVEVLREGDPGAPGTCFPDAEGCGTPPEVGPGCEPCDLPPACDMCWE